MGAWDLYDRLIAGVPEGSTVVDAEPAKFAIKGGSRQLWRAGIKMFTWACPEALR